MANLLRRLNPTRAFNGLWRHGDFVRLWTSLTITHFGGQITFLALPLTGALLLGLGLATWGAIAAAREPGVAAEIQQLQRPRHHPHEHLAAGELHLDATDTR